MNSLRKIIRETIERQIENIQRRMIAHECQVALFEETLDEVETAVATRDEVISALRQGEWSEPDAVEFHRALSKSKHSQMLTPYSTSELSKMKLFKLKDYDIGFALKQFEDGTYSEIVSVFNNEPGISNIGKELMQAAIDNGGCYLDHYDGFLSNLYKSMGFEEYKRYNFDPQYDPDGSFASKYGKADVIFRKHKNCK